ncbi:MAG: hypothetical protein KGN02_12425 [bacterium]|nr:hypothetical protein [bacterium]
MDVQPPPAPGANVATSGVTPPDIFAGAPAPAAGAVSVAAPPLPGATAAPRDTSGIAPAIAKIFGDSGSPQAVNLNVSYRVLKDHEIVTVFTDPKTGKEVAQFPPEILIGLAQFFDQQSGVTFDRNA